jgi:hypothetical protein
MAVNAWVVEDDRDFAELIATAAATTPEVKVTRFFGTGLEVLQSAPIAQEVDEWLPEILIVDVYAFKLDGEHSIDGITLATTMCQIKPALKVLVISSIDVSRVLAAITDKGLGMWRSLQKTGSLSAADIARELTALVSLSR